MASRRNAALLAAVILAVLGGIGYALTAVSHSPSTTYGVNLLRNGGFETGNLTGWQDTYSATGDSPTVEATLVKDGTYGARFETAGNGSPLVQCTLHALECDQLNDSWVFQDVPSVSLSPNTQLRVALYPSFGYPSSLQITVQLQSNPSSNHLSSGVTLYYLVYASSQQCATYRQLLINASLESGTRVYCLSAKQGEWNVITRNIANDLPSTYQPSDFSDSPLTLSLSFAGGSSNDLAYVDSVFFG